MKEVDPKIDSYGVEFVKKLKESFLAYPNKPWVSVHLEYSSLYRQIWIWILIDGLEEFHSILEVLVNEIDILSLNEELLELNLSIILKFPDLRYAHVATLSGHQEVLDCYHQDLEDFVLSDIDLSEQDVEALFFGK